MKPQEIIEGNKLVDIFMDNWLVSRGFSETELNYHSDWNLLMPVVEKIKDTMSLGYFNIDSTWHDELRQEWVVQWSNSRPNRSFCIKRSDFKRDIKLIELVWLAVVEFIKWYNKCQK